MAVWFILVFCRVLIMIKLRIGIPYSNQSNISDITLRSINSLKSIQGLDIYVAKVQGSEIPFARNACINENKSSLCRQNIKGFDYFLALDSDIGFSPQDIINLINRKLPIVSGLYPFKHKRDQAVAGYFNILGQVDNARHIKMSESGLKKVHWFGGGFILISAETFSQLEYPWFRNEVFSFYDKQGQRNQILSGDDVGFCINAHKCGIPLYVDCDCKLQHI